MNFCNLCATSFHHPNRLVRSRGKIAKDLLSFYEDANVAPRGGRKHDGISNSHRVVALPSRDFRISLRRVRIPGANEERSGTLAAARRKKKEAPRPRYVAGTQTGVLVPTSLRIHSRERERVPMYFACASTACSLPPFPSFYSPPAPSEPLRVSRVHWRHERYHVLKLRPRRKRDAWPHLDPHCFSRPPLSVPLFSATLSLLLI